MNLLQKIQEELQKEFGVMQEAGVETWRIEDFKPVKQGPAAFGKFYTGASILVV